jgi:hypothetical protein
MTSNRSLHDVREDVLRACGSLHALTEHVFEHGLQPRVLQNIERITEGFRRLMVELRARESAQ